MKSGADGRRQGYLSEYEKFTTLLRVGHVVVSPHTLHRRDVKNFKWGAMVTVNSSKTKQKGSAHKIPLSRVEDVRLCPVFWLEKIIKIYPGVDSDLLFSTVILLKFHILLLTSPLRGLFQFQKFKGTFLPIPYEGEGQQL